MSFFQDDSGAVTTEWIAVTAFLAVIGIAIVYGIHNTGVAAAINGVNDRLQLDTEINLGPVPNPNGSAGAGGSPVPVATLSGS